VRLFRFFSIILQTEIDKFKYGQMKKRIIGCLLTGLLTLSSSAQISKTLSPYSQFGLGVIAEQSTGFNRGMSGLGIGIRDGKIANVINPASYSAVDSLTMIIDMGVSGQITNHKEGNKKVNSKTADFDYAVTAFRILPKFGASIGVIPYSNIGYSYYDAEWVGEPETFSYAKITDNYYNNTYTGSGGFSQAFLGLGWEFAKGFSIGANMSYFWGKYTKTISAVFNDSYANMLTKTYSTNVNSWKLDLGAQWTGKINENDRLTVGAIAGIGHKLGAEASLSIVNTNTQTSVTTTSTDSVPNGLSIPFTFGAGVSLVHKNSLTLGVDYVMQRWGALDYPMVNETTKRYQATSGVLKDRHKVTIGADWIPDANPLSRGFFKHIHYRLGASYATPYYNIGAVEGPKELAVSAGLAIPIVNTWNNRTTLNVSAQWVNTSAKNLVTENSFRITIGLTFNERWFAKWKVD
jgi:hypothetical protein